MVKYKTIRIRKPGGGTRLQRVRVLANGKYRFVKNTTTTRKRKKTTTRKKTTRRKTRRSTTRKASKPKRRKRRSLIDQLLS